MTKNNIINLHSIRWVVALKEEAKTIIELYRMKIIDGRNLYPIYKNFDGTHWLIVSGMGKQNAAAATAYLYSVSSASDSASWINLGIAGCGIGKYGDLCLVDKISDNSLQNRYPITIPKINLPRMALFTTDVPMNDYSSKELIDMEGIAFYEIASKLTSNEFICLMKVISDGPQNNIKALNRTKIIDLIDLNISDIKKIVSYYEKLSHFDFLKKRKPRLFDLLISKWHFSVTQRHKLESLLRRVETFLPDNNVLEVLNDCKKSSSVLSVLDLKIKKNEVDWSHS